MNRTERERAMLAEMGIAWPQETRPAPEATASAKTHACGDAPAPRHRPASGDEHRPDRAPTPAAAAVATPAAVEVSSTAAAPMPLASPAPASVAVDASGMDWSTLQSAVAQCTACGLCSTRRRTVFGVGASPAPWMIIGEAPGEQEDRQGEPFVGAAGQLLDRMLQAIGLDRTKGSVFITNTVKCRPPQNRNPQPQELQACAGFLQRQIDLVQPRIILAMGRFAAQQLLQSDQPIGRLRGQAHRLPGRPQVAVVVTYHPAYLLRNPIDKGKAWDDLCLAVELFESRSV